jgi:hypothetical protein
MEHSSATVLRVTNAASYWLPESLFLSHITAYSVGVCHSVAWLQNRLLYSSTIADFHAHHRNPHLMVDICTLILHSYKDAAVTQN